MGFFRSRRLRRANALLEEGRSLARQEQWARAETVLREALKARVKLAGPDAQPAVVTRLELARMTALGLHRWAEAEAEIRDCLQRPPAADPAGDLSAHGRVQLAYVLRFSGRLGEARDEARAVMTARDLPANPLYQQAWEVWAMTVGDLGQHGEAVEELAALAAARTRATGPDHPLVLKSRSDRASQLCYLGRFAEAEQELRDILAKVEDSEGKDLALVRLAASNGLSFSLSIQGRYEEAETVVRAAITEATARRHGEKVVAVLWVNLARCLNGQGRHDEALAAVETSRAEQDHLRAASGTGQTSVALAAAAALLGLNRLADAEREARKCLDLCRSYLSPSHHRTLEAESLLASALAGQGRTEEADTLRRANHNAWLSNFGAEHPGTLNAHRLLATTN